MDLLKQQIALKKQLLQQQSQQESITTNNHNKYKRRSELYTADQDSTSRTKRNKADDIHSDYQHIDNHVTDTNSRDTASIQQSDLNTSALSDNTNQIDNTEYIDNSHSNTDQVNKNTTDNNTTLHSTNHDTINDTTDNSIDNNNTDDKQDNNKYANITDINRSNYPSDEKYILAFIKHILYAWPTYMNQNKDNATIQHNLTLQSYKQTKQYLKPLFSSLKNKQLKQDMIHNIVRITDCCIITHDYKQANEIYLLLAIGNAAWPMGVTMVGIHERASRSKLAADNVAHVLNDETARKYIQSIKRIISVCQVLYPNKDDNWTIVK